MKDKIANYIKRINLICNMIDSQVGFSQLFLVRNIIQVFARLSFFTGVKLLYQHEV